MLNDTVAMKKNRGWDQTELEPADWTQNKHRMSVSCLKQIKNAKNVIQLSFANQFFPFKVGPVAHMETWHEEPLSICPRSYDARQPTWTWTIAATSCSACITHEPWTIHKTEFLQQFAKWWWYCLLVTGAHPGSAFEFWWPRRWPGRSAVGSSMDLWSTVWKMKQHKHGMATGMAISCFESSVGWNTNLCFDPLPRLGMVIMGKCTPWSLATTALTLKLLGLSKLVRKHCVRKC